MTPGILAVIFFFGYMPLDQLSRDEVPVRLCATMGRAMPGATRQELLEPIGVAGMMGGGPALMSAPHAQDALEQFGPQPAHGE